MTQGAGAVKVLVLPVLRRYWLYHAWREAHPQQQGAKQTLMEGLQAKVGNCHQLVLPVGSEKTETGKLLTVEWLLGSLHSICMFRKRCLASY